MDFGDQAPKTSLEAAALILSQGQTKDVEKANHIAAGGNPFDMDRLQQAHLRRMMGFDWSLTQNYKKVIVHSNESPFVSESFDFSGEWDEDDVKLLTEACLKLKEAWDEEKAKEAGDEEA